MSTETQTCDVLIVGGGMAGASLALALAPSGLRVTLIEAQPFVEQPTAAYDDRGIALAWGSQRILEGLGLWSELAQEATPIRQIHVSDAGHFGFTRLHADEEGVPALGQVVTGRILGRALQQALQQQEGIRVIAPATLTHFAQGDGTVMAEVVDAKGATQKWQASLLVAADGGNSPIRAQLVEQGRITLQQREYDQHAIVANVTPGKSHQNVAYERFTDQGPLAFLPLADVEGQPRMALVWTATAERRDALLALSDVEFLAALQDKFGGRLGRLQRVGVRKSYPLQMLRAEQSVAGRVVLIGNAAHTLHPVAGQGFNLGLRDVAWLVEILRDAQADGQDIGADAVLQCYEQKRVGDQARTADFTDTLVRVFTHPALPVRVGRSTGLLAMELVAPMRHALAKRNLGLNGPLPRLLRGLKLDAA
ncbi:MAG: 2-octaprenyl-6-methoxyphenyl hydroxylase [Gammaproteobacteria bacterium]